MAISQSMARYREYKPVAALEGTVRAFFTYSVVGTACDGEDAPRRRPMLELARRREDCWSRLYADAHASVIFCFGGTYSIEGLWYPSRPQSHWIGPMSRSCRTTQATGRCFAQVGAYFTAEGVRRFFHSPAELADRVVALGDLWGGVTNKLEEHLAEIQGECSRVAALEAFLMRRMHPRNSFRCGVDWTGVARLARQRGRRLSVAELRGWRESPGNTSRGSSRTKQE